MNVAECNKQKINYRQNNVKILNISRLGNTIKSLHVVGINNKEHLILSGSGDRVSGRLNKLFYQTMVFYEFNFTTGEISEDIFADLNILNAFFGIYRDNLVEDGEGCFLEVGPDGMINIVQCNFNYHTYERLYSVCSVEEFNQYPFVQLKALSNQYLVLKMHNKLTCKIFLYDNHIRRKYYFVWSENDDMRYADFHLLDVNGVPHLLLIKYGKSDFKMEFYIHKWEWSQEYIKYKDEKLFLISLEELASKPQSHFDHSCMIAEIGEAYQLNYLCLRDDCIICSLDDLRRCDENENFYESKICFYDINTKQTTDSIEYYGHLLVSNDDHIYERQYEKEQLTFKHLLKKKEYTLPYQKGSIQSIINGFVIIAIYKGIIVYDFINEREIGTYLTENETSNVRYLPIELRYDYFKKHDLLVLF